jgi:hypothetical protein
MPSLADWLNDLSFQPPASETRQGRKPSTTSLLASPVGDVSGALPQPARASAMPAAAATPASFLVREMVK